MLNLTLSLLARLKQNKCEPRSRFRIRRAARFVKCLLYFVEEEGGELSADLEIARLADRGSE